MILAPLRGVTIRCFRETFADVLHEAGFTEAITPFIPAMPGLDPLKDRELISDVSWSDELELEKGGKCPVVCRSMGKNTSASALQLRLETPTLRVTPQFIGKDPAALRLCLEKIKAAGYETVDFNCGCPYPMVRNKGRGSGILRTPDVLKRMLETGCSVMGEGKFSVKARLGVDRPDELLGLMPLINEFPLRFLTVHARTARQMYEGSCDVQMVQKVQEVSKIPIVLNGDIPFPPRGEVGVQMIGRSFIRYLGTREDIGGLLDRYVEASKAELCGERPVLGRMKELLAYWRDLPQWKRRWPVLKLARSLDELKIW